MNGDASVIAMQRIDRWLWCARFFKTRTLAAKFVGDRSVRVTRNGAVVRADKPSFLIREGDTLVFSRGARLRIVKVLAAAARRGPAREAQTLYADESPPPPPRAKKPADPFVREKGAGRPTKKERRAIAALKGA